MEIRNVENAESLFRLTNPLSIAAQGVIPSPYSQPATTIISRVSLLLMNFAAKIAGAALVCVLCACANVLDQSAALATTPYTIEDGGRIIIEAEVNDRGPFEFALDTAAIVGAGMFTQRDFIIDFVRNRLLVNVAGAEADRVDMVACP